MKSLSKNSKQHAGSYPQRIVCMSAETTELLYALGAGDRVIGVSGYSVRPPEAREKPKISAFTTAKIDKILGLKPDLVLAFSDLQADIAKDLIKKGVNVLALNQRSIAETLQTALWLGRLIGAQQQAKRYVEMFQGEMDRAKSKASAFSKPPRVYFEEWDDPMISGIAWVSEIVGIAGGKDVFPELGVRKLASERIVTSRQVIRRNPQIILASWCGKKAQLEKIRARPGWDKIDAVKEKQVFEIKSPDILQPGPSLLRGLRQIQEIIVEHVNRHCEEATSRRSNPVGDSGILNSHSEFTH